MPFHAVYRENRSGAGTGEKGGRERGSERASVIEDEDSVLTSRKLLQMMRVSLVTPH